MLDRNTYFIGDIICQQGDVNSTMYFIHTGIVDTYSVSTYEQVLVEQLKAFDSFGMVSVASCTGWPALQSFD